VARFLWPTVYILYSSCVVCNVPLCIWSSLTHTHSCVWISSCVMMWYCSHFTSILHKTVLCFISCPQLVQHRDSHTSHFSYLYLLCSELHGILRKLVLADDIGNKYGIFWLSSLVEFSTNIPHIIGNLRSKFGDNWFMFKEVTTKRPMDPSSRTRVWPPSVLNLRGLWYVCMISPWNTWLPLGLWFTDYCLSNAMYSSIGQNIKSLAVSGV